MQCKQQLQQGQQQQALGHLFVLSLCRLIAAPEYRRRVQAAAAPAAAPGGLEADDSYSPIDLIIYSYEPPECPETYVQDLHSRWLKVLQRLHKAAEVRAYVAGC
jgi:hypothetical protein